MGKGVDLTGRRFGRLTALRPTGGRRHGGLVWLCRCACGRMHEAPVRCLQGRNTRSCGCLRRETTPRNAGYAPQPGRDVAMQRDRAAGATLAELAVKYGVSRQRVHQVVTSVRRPGESAAEPYDRRTA